MRSCTWEVRGCWAWGETRAQPSTCVLDGVVPLGGAMAGHSPGSAGPGCPTPALQKAQPMLGAPLSPPCHLGQGARSGFGACSASSLGPPGWSWVSICAEQSGSLSLAISEQGGALLLADPSQGS